MTGLRAKRNRAFESLDFEKGRADLKQRRKANLDRLPELIEQFKTRLEAVGGKVHFAKDAAEARDIIAQICWNAGTMQPKSGPMIVTKVKSMATEEIELNPFLEALGMEVVETDLGERMVQLTHTRPSHLIAPAIHLTKEDAANVFGTEATVEAIQLHARNSLRQKFIDLCLLVRRDEQEYPSRASPVLLQIRIAQINFGSIRKCRTEPHGCSPPFNQINGPPQIKQ